MFSLFSICVQRYYFFLKYANKSTFFNSPVNIYTKGTAQPVELGSLLLNKWILHKN